MHGRKAEGAFHDPYEFRVRARIESGGGPSHSKTLARRPQSLELPPGFGDDMSSWRASAEALHPPTL